MAEPKTKLNDASVAKFIESVKDEQVRDDCNAIIALMEAATKDKARMWGSAIVGFGLKKVVYASGKETDWMAIGFSPRKGNIALYGLGIAKQWKRCSRNWASTIMARDAFTSSSCPMCTRRRSRN